MADERKPFDVLVRLEVEADDYDTARAVARVAAERVDEGMVKVGAGLYKLKLRDLRVERRGAMRP